eukprot:6540733-Pyramimonas_sp.AAC.1
MRDNGHYRPRPTRIPWSRHDSRRRHLGICPSSRFPDGDGENRDVTGQELTAALHAVSLAAGPVE